LIIHGFIRIKKNKKYKKFVLLDEVDGLSGTKDRGGVSTMAKLLDGSAFPIILTAINPFTKNLSSLRKKASLMEFVPLDYKDVYNILNSICLKENVTYDESVLKSLCRRSGGDVRAAINDLQSLTAKDKILDKKDLDLLGDRERTESMLQALVKILKAKDINLAVQAFNNVEEDFDKRFLWLEENIPKEYRNPADLARAFDYLSKADVFRGRIRRWQHWRYLVYVNTLMTAGVCISKEERYREFVTYKPTERLLKYYIANMRFAKRKTIAAKIAEKTHNSAKDVIKNTLPYVQLMVRNGNSDIVDYFDFGKDEVSWLKK